MNTGELLPLGVRDYHGKEVLVHRYLEEQTRNTFQKWGYTEIITPSFEFYEQLKIGVGPKLLEKSYKLVDNHGRVLALRPEMTTSIARVAATSLREEKEPLRYYYIANIFRVQEPGSGHLHEFYQAGGEILGSPSPEADAEIIALASDCLHNLGIEDFKIGIGQVAFLKSLLKDANLDSASMEQIMDYLQNRNLVGLEMILKTSALPASKKNFIWEILTKNGNGNSEALLTSILARVGPEAELELLQLRDLFKTLAAHSISKRVYLDLSIVRNIDYYTGVIFEIYGPGLGRPLGGGGRYNDLMARFGRNLPSTGFALGFPELLSVCNYQDVTIPKPPLDYYVAPSPAHYIESLKYARELREKGFTVEVQIEQTSKQQSKEFARKKGYENIVYFEPGKEEIVPLCNKEGSDM